MLLESNPGGCQFKAASRATGGGARLRGLLPALSCRRVMRAGGLGASGLRSIAWRYG
jgi:hypothetical protein